MLEALESPPGGADPFFWTDFVELRALIHPDRCFSRGDLATLERRSRDTTDKKGFPAEERWRDLVNFAKQRGIEFGGSYPFSISDDQDTLALDYDGSTAKKSYLKFLIASLMRHIPSGRRAELARHFERAAFLIFEKLMPQGSQVRATWANGGAEALYVGTLFEKMKLIAKDIRCTPNFKDRDFKGNDTGDGGVDLISWHPMADNRPGMPIAFAQCGCSKDDWRFKQLEASYTKHSSRLPVMHPWATYYFLPLDLRHPDGGWAYESDIGQAIIVDRLRLMRLVTQYGLDALIPDLPLLDDICAMSYA